MKDNNLKVIKATQVKVAKLELQNHFKAVNEYSKLLSTSRLKNIVEKPMSKTRT
jgi:hypothetical protein